MVKKKKKNPSQLPSNLYNRPIPERQAFVCNKTGRSIFIWGIVETAKPDGTFNRQVYYQLAGPGIKQVVRQDNYRAILRMFHYEKFEKIDLAEGDLVRIKSNRNNDQGKILKIRRIASHGVYRFMLEGYNWFNYHAGDLELVFKR